MTHKEKCKQMKSIRKTIADKLGVDLHQRECTYKGDCRGTCPRCEHEEKTLNKILLKNSAAVAGLAMSAISLTGCGSIEDRTTESKINTDDIITSTTAKEPSTTTTSEELDGDITIEGLETDPSCTVTQTTQDTQLAGEAPPPTTEMILEGTMAEPLEGDDPTEYVQWNDTQTITDATTEDEYELDGDIAIINNIDDKDITNACLAYSGADTAEIESYTDEQATVICKSYFNEIDPATGKSRAVITACISVDRISGAAVDDKGKRFSIYDYLENE